MISLLLVDDNSSFRKALAIFLKNNEFIVAQAESGEEAIPKLKQKKFDLVLTDLKMEQKSGIEVLKESKKINPDTEVILLTAFGSIPSAVEAVKMGAFDYLTKPCDNQKLLFVLKKALDKKKLLSEAKSFMKKPKARFDFSNIVYKSKSMKKILTTIKKIAQTDITVFIQGKSGTGKELLVVAIYRNSLRANKPLQVVNCSIPETLLESELFGYVKGAFTGAFTDKKGMFEQADGGTVFLDEICDTSPALQAGLLRVIQEKELRRVGDNSYTRIDVRLIAATNKDLLSLAKQGRFREDLYYRLNVIPIYIPPLRERKEDIIPLAEHFIKKYSQKLGKKTGQITPQMEDALLKYHWPGNVRELENAIEGSVALAPSNKLDSSFLLIDTDISFLKGVKSSWSFSVADSSKDSLKGKEKEHILSILEKHRGNKSKTAKELGIGRTTLYRKLKEFQNDEDVSK